ncbi:DUF3492 domain-containing protein [Streptomyces sp. NPDC058459]|uniref:DUF3492 domain-containing protein n=1 Tax=Streptomyces sp. NPDC058459 TaxID=3346508 RepID=UPI0036593797
MRIGLLTESGYPCAGGDTGLWCDRLVRGLGQHEFDIYALSRGRRREDNGRLPIPPQVRRVRTARLRTAGDDGAPLGRRARKRFAEHYGELLGAVCGTQAGSTAELADRFGNALYNLAERARDTGALTGALRSDHAVSALERACRAPGAPRTAREARVPDLLAVTGHPARALRPLSLDRYGDGALGAVDLCHATSGGSAALPGLLARHFSGVPPLVTEYGVQLRAHYLALGPGTAAPAVRALLAAFHGRLATEFYRRAELLTPGSSHARRRQERCGADRARIRTVRPGMDAARYLARCRAPAARLFPDEAEGPQAAGDNPVTFTEVGAPEAPTPPDAYAAGAVVVLSSVVEGLPVSPAEAMFCGRAAVSTAVGAVVEVVGGTGLVVPPRNPRALAEVCGALLRDPERRARLGAAGRARALELFGVEQNIAAFHGIYLEIMSRCPARGGAVGDIGGPLPFAVAAEAHVPGHRTMPTARTPLRGRGSPAPVRATEGTR